MELLAFTAKHKVYFINTGGFVKSPYEYQVTDGNCIVAYFETLLDAINFISEEVKV